MQKTKLLKDLKQGDTISGNEHGNPEYWEIITNNNGLLFCYGQKSGFFKEFDYTKQLKKDPEIMVFII